jgi:hypothetical protein
VGFGRGIEFGSIGTREAEGRPPAFDCERDLPGRDEGWICWSLTGDGVGRAPKKVNMLSEGDSGRAGVEGGTARIVGVGGRGAGAFTGEQIGREGRGGGGITEEGVLEIVARRVLAFAGCRVAFVEAEEDEERGGGGEVERRIWVEGVPSVLVSVKGIAVGKVETAGVGEEAGLVAGPELAATAPDDEQTDRGRAALRGGREGAGRGGLCKGRETAGVDGLRRGERGLGEEEEATAEGRGG